MQHRSWIVAIIVLVLLAMLATAAVLFYSAEGEIPLFGERRDKPVKAPRRFNTFSAFTDCETAIKKNLGGKVLSVESDDRAAKYDYRENLNLLFFKAVYRPEKSFFGGIDYREKEVFVRCDASAETNEIVALRVRPSEGESYSELSWK